MRRRILVADDSVTVRKVVELTFSGEEYDIVFAADGSAALERARAERPAVIISDVGMPGLDGYELCRRVKSDPELRSTPFLFLKGTFEGFDEDRAGRCGADGFIVKPFESQEMIRRVKELIAAAPAQAPAAPVPVAPRLEAASPASVAPQSPAPATPSPQLLEVPDEDLGLEVGLEEEVLLRPVFETSPAAPVAAAPPPASVPPRIEPIQPVQPAPVAPAPPAPALEPPGMEAEEDLWSEVSLRDSAAPVPGAEEDDSIWSSEPVELLEEAIEAPVDEEIFEELSTERFEPPPAPVEAEPLVASAPEAAVRPALEAPPAAPVPLERADLERLVASRIEPALREVIAPLVADMAKKVIDEVAWEVIPDLAEVMIRREIERIKQSTGRG